MLNTPLKEAVFRLLPGVVTPAQYIGGELNSVVKDHRQVRGRLCLAFPDTYQLGMSHHGLQVLYSLLNADPQWACERAFTPWIDWESALRGHRLPLYSLETFTPLREFDLVGFSLQYEVSYTNVLTMLDLGGVPLFSTERRVTDSLVIAGGPGAQNPELLAPFVDLFVIGDGEESLAWIMEKWVGLKEKALRDGDLSFRRRQEMLAEMVGSTTWAYAPMFYEPEYHADGTLAAMHRTRADVPKEVMACTIGKDLDAIPLPMKPVVPFIQTPHDRIAIEIMRGCPHQCRFCQSTVIKRPLRLRSVETIVQSALESYRNTGTNEISLLSLSTSDYPHFEELVKRMHEVFSPLGVNVSLPSLRINHQLRTLPQLMSGARKAGLTLAPEVARDDMREQIRKKIKNDDLYEGCREAFKNGWQRVKLYFLCGLPGERMTDLDGIIEMAETIARIGREVRKKPTEVTASVSNFVPKPHTPYQWNGMQTREYFQWAGHYLKGKVRNKSVYVKQHDVETSLLEGLLTRGDRRIAPVVYEAWRRGARLDAWRECFKPDIWWKAVSDLGIDFAHYVHRQRPISELLPWDHVNVKKGRAYLEKEQERSLIQLNVMAEASAGHRLWRMIDWGGPARRVVVQSPTRGCGGWTMLTGLSFKTLALRFLPEGILQHIRKAHYARKLAVAKPEPEMAVLRHLLPQGGWQLDLGANFGLYTRFLAEAVGSDGVVHAVEPVPVMYDVLRSNVRRLGLKQVRTHPVAISDVTRTVSMAVPQYATGGSNFYEARVLRSDRPAGTTVRVPGVRLDDLFGHLPRVDVIKCDVEGHELSVLRGAEAFLRRHRPAWLMEVSGNPDDRSAEAAEVVRRMRAEGYEIFRFDGLRLRPRQAGERAVNYFFLRPEHLARLPCEMMITTSGHTTPE